MVEQERTQGPFGGKWTTPRVRDTLANEKYAGNALLQKKYRNNHIDKALLPNRGELPQYYATETHLAIIDEATFAAAQQALARIAETHHASPPVGRHAFSGMIICAACGKPYRRVINHGSPRWACPTFIREGKAFCQSKKIPEDTIKQLACRTIGQDAFDEAAFRATVHHITAIYPYTLVFHLNNGLEKHTEWQSKSRAESWTPEMKVKAHASESLRRSRVIAESD